MFAPCLGVAASIRFQAFAAAPAESQRGRRAATCTSADEAFAYFESADSSTDPGAAARRQEPIQFVCECGDKDCDQRLVMTAAGFTTAHSAPNRFIVKPGHVYPDVERIVTENETFAVVEKQPARR